GRPLRLRALTGNQELEEPRTLQPRSWSPVDSAAELEPPSLDDDAGRVVARADRFVHRQNRREVRQIEDLHEWFDARATVAEGAGDARVDRFHVVVVLRRWIDDRDREVAAAGERDTGHRAVEGIERSDADPGPGLKRDAQVDVVGERVRARRL